jgi:LPPG:FO 2-phospho-L-lactate transferase
MGVRRAGGARGQGGPARVVALAGGVGAARFLQGLVRVIDPTTLTVVVNTADDIERHGLHVSPDVDSVVYTLAGIHDAERGWGLRDETWQCLECLRTLGEETWFQLGDRDMATHIWRSARLRAGSPLSAITRMQCDALGVAPRILPMTDHPVTTMVTCAGLGELHVQEYFVRERCEPVIEAIRYVGLERARPAPGVLEAIVDAEALIVCPSNPVMSIQPVLALPGVRAAAREVPQSIAITPIVAGKALKGPAAAMLAHVGVEVSAAGVASLYRDFCQTMVVDRRDEAVARAVEAHGVRAVVAETVMDGVEGAVALATKVCVALGLGGPPAVAA